MSEEQASIYGKYNDDGTVTEPECSILTGQPISKGGSVRERVSGSPYFYRFEGAFEHRVTGELRQQWQTGAPSEARKVQPVSVKRAEPSED